ncbi:cobaltochelatase subunit CobN [Methanococcoides sp. NM1]|uniref:cobaltochelatase subunit CobN n=1 Tax=Methanococcoides sp. NM1 TaxID=1201013 RepID=UPI00143834F3|nr:cobaltochelatase subunit CobN [Methanococcoides sp. NM1]
MIDISDSDNIIELSNAINNGSITGRRIALTQEAHNLSDVSQSVQDNASLYWTWSDKNLQNFLVYAATELDGRDDLVTYVQQPIRTSVLLVVLPNHATIMGVMDELSEYGIDCQFANLTAISMVARDQSQADFVNAEIDAWEGDIIFEFVADSQYDLYKDHISVAGDRGVKVLGVGGFSTEAWHSQNVENGDAVLSKLFSKSSKSPGYWRTVLPENLVRMFIYVTNEADNRPDLASFVKPTMTVPPAAIYHPDAPSCTYNGDQFEHLFLTREDYNNWYISSGHYNASDEWIGIAMYYRDYQEGKMHTEDAMIRKLEEDGYNVIASYVPWSSPINHFYDNSDETYRVDAIISFMFFGATGPSTVLEISDVPVLKAVSLSYQTYPQWEQDPYGLNGMAITWKLDQPEMDGVICPIPVEAQFTEEDDVRYPIMDRVERILGQAKSYADLRHTANEDKKIAIIYFNHPPGKHDVGASYLNLFESLELMLDSLEMADYTVQNMSSEELQRRILLEGRNVGSWAPGELDALVEEGLRDDSIVLLDSDLYEGWFGELPEDIRHEVTETWGAPPGEMMVVNREGKDYIVLPMIKNGNVILTPQPARGWEEDVSSLYHDLNIPVPHQYMAFYLWLQHQEEEGGFGADALVHVGRHGTHEWLPGKMVCLNSTSYSDLLLADMPNIYPYIVDGAGEGIQAKRRGYATLISHLTPPIAHSGLYGELTNLKFNLMRYQQYKQTNYTIGMTHTRENVLDILNNSTVDEDLGLEINDNNFEITLEEMVEYIEDLTSETIPYGTHIFGNGPEGQKAAMFIESMHADLLLNTSCELFGYNTTRVSAGGIDVMQERWEADNLSTWLAGSVINCSSEIEFVDSVALHLNRSLDDGEVSTLNQTFDAATRTYLLLNCSGEITSFVHALDGGYVSPSEQGDPVNNPEVLPTGRNYYGFNSKKVPDPTTWEIGKELADEMLIAYYNEHGQFPEKIGVSLWSVETLRHNGVMESMVLRLMGAEPSFYISKSGAFSKVYNDRVVVSPLYELTIVDANGTVLQRPRVDVVITTSGLYRDTLQYQMRLLDVAAHTISEQNESISDNYVRKHSLEIEEALLAMNETEQQRILDTYMQADPGFDGNFTDLAAYFSELRIFAPPPGGYGVGIEKEIEAGGTDWNSSNSTQDIADLYIFRMANMYTTDSEGVVHHLGNYESVFRENLDGTEIVFNSRSTSLYGVLDNDDFFQYVGGLSVAIEHISGTAPEIKVVNLRGDPKVEGLDMFLARELRTRALNPLYLTGMMDSGYSGMKEIAEIVDNLYGWQVTTPGLVEDYMWNDIYETLVLDKHGLGIKEAFNDQNPYAYQSTAARMLEAIRKGYWDASDETIQTLTKEYAESVAENGVTCCHHTCGNPLLDEYVRGLMSIPGVVSEEVAQDYNDLMSEATQREIQTSSSSTAKKHSSGGGTGTAEIIESGSGNQTQVVDGGYGTDVEQSPQLSSSSDSETNYVEGYEMTKESTTSESRSSSPSFSGADILGSVLVVLAVAVITIGFRRRRI